MLYIHSASELRKWGWVEALGAVERAWDWSTSCSAAASEGRWSCCSPGLADSSCRLSPKPPPHMKKGLPVSIWREARFWCSFIRVKLLFIASGGKGEWLSGSFTVSWSPCYHTSQMLSVKPSIGCYSQIFHGMLQQGPAPLFCVSVGVCLYMSAHNCIQLCVQQEC